MPAEGRQNTIVPIPHIRCVHQLMRRPETRNGRIMSCARDKQRHAARLPASAGTLSAPNFSWRCLDEYSVWHFPAARRRARAHHWPVGPPPVTPRCRKKPRHTGRLGTTCKCLLSWTWLSVLTTRDLKPDWSSACTLAIPVFRSGKRFFCCCSWPCLASHRKRVNRSCDRIGPTSRKSIDPRSSVSPTTR